HRVIGNCFGARHGEHRPFTEVWSDRGKAKAAVTQDDGSHAVPAGDSAVWVPANLGVVMGVQINETRSNDQPVGINRLFCEAWRFAANLGDFTVFHPDVSAATRRSRSINNCSTLDVEIKISHRFPPSNMW